MTNATSPKIIRRLQLRGMDISQDPAFLKMVPWSVTTFALCGLMVGLATAFAFTPLLWAMVPIALLGALMPRHPFDAIYNYGIRRLTGTAELPKNAAPVRFTCGIAIPWIVAIAASFETGYSLIGTILGFTLVGVSALVSTTHFCIPSAIYQFLFGDRRLIVPALTGTAPA